MNFIKKIFKHNEQVKIDDIKYNQSSIPKDIYINRQNLEKTFKNCDDIIYRTMTLNINGITSEILLVYLSSLVDLNNLNDNIIRPLNIYMEKGKTETKEPKATVDVIRKIVNIDRIKMIYNWQECIQGILSGNTLILVSHHESGLILNTQCGVDRNISESPVESVIRGPRDSFIENVDINIGLIRNKIKSTSLKVEKLLIGYESHTTVAIIYMENLVNKQALSNIMDKLNSIRINAILGSGYIEQYLESSPYSPFPQIQITERPDKVCGNLVEGKISIIIDGSPVVLILPITFFQLFQSPEDYYERILSSNFLRALRFLGFLIATSLPSIYVALISFHHEMIPMNLIVDFSRTRANVAFPPVIEAILMEITIELLREASIRLPRSIGQTIGVVGAIVIGEAAIQSNLASPAMVIVVSITAIGSYVFPHYSTSYALRLIRFPIIIMAATFGAFGIIIAWCWIIVHLCSLESFGHPYLSPLSPLDKSIIKDGVTRGNSWR